MDHSASYLRRTCLGIGWKKTTANVSKAASHANEIHSLLKTILNAMFNVKAVHWIIIVITLIVYYMNNSIFII